MPTAFEGLQRASFDGVEFPVKAARVHGGLRDHVHEYPHSPGGAPEKLGRKLYEFHVTPIFDARVDRVAWPNNWPGNLARLTRKFELELTATLVIPIIGAVQAYATDWSQAMVNKKLSGPDVEWVFREDQSSAFLVDQLIKVNGSLVGTLSDTLVVVAAADGFQPDFFQSVTALADQVLGYVDQVEAADAALAAKVDGLSALCEAFDAKLELADPKNCRTLAALHDLWQADNRLRADLLKRATPLVFFAVPRPMTVADVSVAIYSDALHVSDILRLNALDDPFRIPAGTVVKAYAP